METEEKLVIFDKYPNELDANIIKGAIESSGIHAGVLGDSTANAIWMAPVSVVVFRRDLKAAIQAVYQADKKYEDYQDEMDLQAFENMQACNNVFGELALMIHPEIVGNQYRELYAQAKDALAAGDLKALTAIKARIPASLALEDAVKPMEQTAVAEPRKIHGWLLLYLVLSVVIDIAAIVILFTDSSRLVSDMKQLSMLAFLVATGCVMTGCLIPALINRRPDAVFLGKHHVIINAIPAICVLYWMLDHIDNASAVILLLILFVGGIVVWRHFFGASSQVKALIPPSTRKVGKKVVYFVIFIYTVIGLVYIFNYGLEKWWVSVLAFWGVLSLSPLGDFFSYDDKENPEQ